MVYSPEQDSFMLEKEVLSFTEKLTEEQKKKIQILDMGSGSGIQALSCIIAGIPRKNILCADIDEEAIRHLKEEKLRVIKSDLFSKIKAKDKFNLIIFNPPYLPESKYDKMPDTTAGKRGNETIIRFLKEAKHHLAKEGVILLLFSSLSKPEEILKEAKKLGYKAEKLSEVNTGMMEKLVVWKFY